MRNTGKWNTWRTKTKNLFREKYNERTQLGPSVNISLHNNNINWSIDLTTPVTELHPEDRARGGKEGGVWALNPLLHKKKWMHSSDCCVKDVWPITTLPQVTPAAGVWSGLALIFTGWVKIQRQTPAQSPPPSFPPLTTLLQRRGLGCTCVQTPSLRI